MQETIGVNLPILISLIVLLMVLWLMPAAIAMRRLRMSNMSDALQLLLSVVALVPVIGPLSVYTFLVFGHRHDVRN